MACPAVVVPRVAVVALVATSKPPPGTLARLPPRLLQASQPSRLPPALFASHSASFASSAPSLRCPEPRPHPQPLPWHQLCLLLQPNFPSVESKQFKTSTNTACASSTQPLRLRESPPALRLHGPRAPPCLPNPWAPAPPALARIPATKYGGGRGDGCGIQGESSVVVGRVRIPNHRSPHGDGGCDPWPTHHRRLFSSAADPNLGTAAGKTADAADSGHGTGGTVDAARAAAGSGGGGGGAVASEGTDGGDRRASRRAAARAGKPPVPQRGRFIDSAVLRVRGGRGGPGRVSYEPVGRGRHLAATGGSGGAGGDVIIRASGSGTSLYGMLPVVVAGGGGAGGAAGRTGARGADRVIDMPLGTTMRVWPAAAATAAAVEGEDGDGDEDGGTEDVDGYMEEGYNGNIEGFPEEVEEHTGDEDEDLDPGFEQDGEGGEDGAGVEGEGEGARRGAADPRVGAYPSQPQSPPVLEVELCHPGQAVVVARGGAGGRGNGAFPAMPGRPASQESEPGAPGEEFWVRLETRLLADVGFVGLPNAGKSTLLGAITAARAKVGSYAFTTVRPQLGTISYGDGTRLVTADIPGLVQGAHANRGRGNAFLRHIERCRCLAYVLDLSGGNDGGGGGGGMAGGVANGAAAATWRQRDASPPRNGGAASGGGRSGGGDGDVDGEAAARASVGTVPLPPAEQLRVLQEELRLYNPGLLAAPSLIIANKLDRCTDPRVALSALMAATPLPILPVSAAHGLGLVRLKEALRAVARPPGKPTP